MTNVLIIIGVFLGTFFGCYFYYHPRLKAKKQEDLKLVEKENYLKNSISELKNRKQDLEQDNKDLSLEKIRLEIETKELHKSVDNLVTSLPQKQKDIDASLTSYYDSRKEIAESGFEQAVNNARENYLQAEKDFQEQYEAIKTEIVKSWTETCATYEANTQEIKEKLKEAQIKFDCITEALKRAEEMDEKEKFYKLQLPTEDLEEIEKLREVSKYLRDKEPLNKIIWKCYYEKPTTDLIGRAIGKGTHTGIYKITNTLNGMSYVGQSVNIADRWKQHIKRGLGADTPTRNKLYPAMATFGVENFTFEIIEECNKEQLDEREDYYQDFFHTKDYGYSIK